MKLKGIILTAAILLMSIVTKAANAQAAVAETRSPIWVSVPTSGAPLQLLQVKAPASGNMIVTMTGTVVYEHLSGTPGNFCLQLSQTSSYVGGCAPDSGSDSAIRSYIASGSASTVAGYGASSPYSIVRTFPVTAGTTYTFYLNGYSDGLTSWLFQPSINALYVPGTLVQ